MKTIQYLVSVAAFSMLFASSCWAVSPPQPAAEPAKVPETVYALIKQKKELSKFADLIASSGAEDVLTKKLEFLTVFAPTNSAMDKIPSDVAKKLKADKESKKTFVLYHTIIGSEVQSGNIRNRRAGVGMGNGEMVAFDGLGKDLKVNDSKIVLPDLVAQNGIVHEMDSALISPSLLGKPVDKGTEEAKKKEQPVPFSEIAKQNREKAEEQNAAAPSATTVPSTSSQKPSASSTATPKSQNSVWDKVKSWWNNK